MLQVSSPDYSLARSVYTKAKDAFQLADKSYKRAQDLLAHKAIAEKDLEQAESDRAQAQADVASTGDALRVLGIADPDTPPAATLQIPVLAPVSGEIVERLVGPGQLLVVGATQAFTISDTTKVWVLVNVYQGDMGSVHVGDAAEITTDAYPQAFRGKISYIAPAMDPTTRTLQERIETENPDHKLKKDMYVTATVHSGAIEGAVPGTRYVSAARHRESAVCLRSERDESICAAIGDARRFSRRENARSRQRPDRGRECCRRWQPLPPVPELHAAVGNAQAKT